MKYTIKVHPLIGLLFMLAIVAALIIIPVMAFYVAPKALIWAVNWLVSSPGQTRVPFNLFTWAIAMYLLWVTGVVRITTSSLKTAVDQMKPKAAAK